MRLPFYMCMTCFLEQYQRESLCVCSIFHLVTEVQQLLSYIQPLLSSLNSMGFAESENGQLVLPYFSSSLIGCSCIPRYSDAPCDYKNCCSECWNRAS
ncbi:unnamed protein product, partial [Schistosoma rodhaini]|uniref:Uncharacterized protein n=1 Tax=Schistosoma rodhaini TaxID=6188 RepID=A0AA85FBC6_9TREM